MMEKEEKENITSKAELLIVKEKFYEEEDISPEVRKVLDDVFDEMVSQEPNKSEPVKAFKIPDELIEPQHNIDVMKEKEKLYNETNVSPEVRKVLDDVFNEMVSSKSIEIETKSRGMKGKTIEKSKKPHLKLEELTIKEKELEKEISKYRELITAFEEKSKASVEAKTMFENRLKELEETKLEYEERSIKLEQARNSFMKLSTKIEEKKVELEQKEKNLNQMQRELEKLRLKIEDEKKVWDKTRKHKKYGNDLEEIEDNLTDYSDQVYSLVETQDTSELVQMEKGKVEILKDILQELSFQGNFQSCFLIDGQGMIISEYSKTEMDALAIGAMFSLVCTTVLRTVRSLSLNELEYFKLSSLNGEFIIRNIDIVNYERNFILLAYYNESNLNLPSSTAFRLNRKQINRIIRSIKSDFYDLRKSNKISWVFDNIIEKVDFLKQKYNQVNGDINIIRLNLMNKASIKIRELFES